MAGGTFDKTAGKTRPGTYINFESTRNDMVGGSERGTVLIPLFGHSYGPDNEFITIEGTAPDAQKDKLGYSIYDNEDNMLLIREALKNASKVIVCLIKSGEKATATVGALKATAKYSGAAGNEFSFKIENSTVEGVDVTIYNNGNLENSYEGLKTVEELIAKNNEWIDFAGTGNLTVTDASGVTLSGGDDNGIDNSAVTEFLNKSENISWNTMAFPLDSTDANAQSLYEAVKDKIKYLREKAGKYRKAVLPNFVADYEGIINLTNSVVLADNTELTVAQATAWVAGIDAGAPNTKSNTYAKYNGAIEIIGAKTNEEAVAAINKGEFFFSYSEAGDIVVEYDINSLTTFDKPKDKTYRKNRVLRVFDTFAESIMLNFPPNKYDNSPDGWDVMEGIGASILKQFEDAGAIKNVDTGNDFKVDRGMSSGDETYFTVGLEPVDSAEKLFFTINTR